MTSSFSCVSLSSYSLYLYLLLLVKLTLLLTPCVLLLLLRAVLAVLRSSSPSDIDAELVQDVFLFLSFRRVDEDTDSVDVYLD